jgi:hypothetical protein
MRGVGPSSCLTQELPVAHFPFIGLRSRDKQVLMKSTSWILLVGLIAATSLAAGQKSQPRIDEIVLEATQGDNDGLPYGPCFKITFRKDGTAFFTGKAKVKLIGDYQGTISDAEFKKLVAFLITRRYSQIPDDPINAWQITLAAGSVRVNEYGFSPWMTTSIIEGQGQTKTISRPTNVHPLDGKRIPKGLLEIEQAVFDTATRIQWKKLQ